jgi:putative acetyltransferase
MNDFMIRTIQLADNFKVAQMIRTVFHDYDARQDGTVYSDPTTDELFQLFQTPNSIFFLVEKEGEILGSCGVFPTQGLPDGYAELVKFYVSSAIRGQGFGRQLFQQCEAWAKKQGYSHLYLESMNDFISAVKLYEKIGFSWLEAPLGNTGHFGSPLWREKKS